MGCFDFVPKWPDNEVKSKEKNAPSGSGQDNAATVNSSSHVPSDLSTKADVDAVSSLESAPINPPSNQFSQSVSLRKPNDLRDFTFHELRYATDNFNRKSLLGEGGFGQVFKGTIRQKQGVGGDENIDVAVKQLNAQSGQGHREWLAEVHFLGLVDSPHLVKLIGYCADDFNERGNQRLLVYEFMQNKGLDDHLFRLGPNSLSWPTRVKIILGAALGLAYLHEDMEIQVIFRDFKTSNVLLDGDFNSKLSDFGLARQGPEDGFSTVSTAVVGTAGYAAPEYIQTGHLSLKSDVWSFGVVMLELLSGRRVMDRNRPKNEQSLVEWAKPYVNDPYKFCQIVDPALGGNYPVRVVQRFAQLAYQCLNKVPKNRPKMSEVVENLRIVQDKTLQWESTPSQSPLHRGRMTMESRSLSASQELSRAPNGSPNGLPLGLSGIKIGKPTKSDLVSFGNADILHRLSNRISEGSSHAPKFASTSAGSSSTAVGSKGENQTLENAEEEAKLAGNVVEERKHEDSSGDDSSATADIAKKKSRAGPDRLARMNRESGRFNWIPRLSFSTNTH